MELSRYFATQVAAQGKPAEATAELEGILTRFLEEAHAAWPGLALPDEAFLTHLAERLPANVEVTAGLYSLHVTDLYLACACARGDAQAVALFEDRFMARVARFLAGSLDRNSNELDEIKQTLRAHLLVGDEKRTPRIGEYAGRGPLGAWLRRASLRLVLMARRRARPEEPLVPDSAPLTSASPDPELLYLKVRYGHELDVAFREALHALSERESTLLQLYFINGLTAEAVASIYKVAESTVRRWLGEIRARLLEDTRKRLAGRLELSNTASQSLLAVLHSQLDLSLFKLLKEKEDS